MKTINKYQCEFCHTEYAAKYDATVCEKNHKTPVGIKECRYQPKNVLATGYPYKIFVNMDDGTVVLYELKGAMK